MKYTYLNNKLLIVSSLELIKGDSWNRLFLLNNRGRSHAGQQSNSISTSYKKCNHTGPTPVDSDNKLNVLKHKLPAVYPDLLADKSSILKQNKGKSGIYMLTNKITKKIYIGKSTNLRARFYEYFSPHLKDYASSSLICKALIKFGFNNFSLSILEYCKPDILLAKEQFFITALKPQYNIRKSVSKNKSIEPVSFLDGTPILPKASKTKKSPQIIYPSIVLKFLELTTQRNNRKKVKG